jgi:hypothetical protein
MVPRVKFSASNVPDEPRDSRELTEQRADEIRMVQPRLNDIGALVENESKKSAEWGDGQSSANHSCGRHRPTRFRNLRGERTGVSQ